MADANLDPDLYTKMMNLTSNYHRDVYPAVSISNTQNSASGKVVLITGASRGIGKHLALSWAEAGALGIVITSRKISDLHGVVDEINKASSGNTKVLALAVEVTKDEDVKNVFEKAKEKFGKMDVVIANAGIMAQENLFPKIGEFAPDSWWQDIEVNVRGVHLTAYHFINTFGPKGTFINMTSGSASVIMPGNSSYGISKLACIRIVEYLSSEYPELRAFSMNPGIVKDVVWRDAFKPFAQDSPALVGAFSVWLSTPGADCVKGGYVCVNWDVEELMKNEKEIKEKGLLKLKFWDGIVGIPGGYTWGKQK